QDTDNGVGGAIQPDCLSDDIRGRLEAPAPQPVTQHGHAPLTGLRLLRQKCAPEDRLNRKHIEEFARNHTGADELRIARSRQRKVVPMESRHALEDLVTLLIIQEAWRRKSRLAAPTVSARIGSPHHHNPVWVFVRKWPK